MARTRRQRRRRLLQQRPRRRQPGTTISTGTNHPRLGLEAQDVKRWEACGKRAGSGGKGGRWDYINYRQTQHFFRASHLPTYLVQMNRIQRKAVHKNRFFQVAKNQKKKKSSPRIQA